MEFIHGDKKVFDDFIKNMKEEDEIALISHNDVDGIISAFLLAEYLIKRKFNIKYKKFVTYQKNFIGDMIPELKKYDITKVFITDLQVDSDDFDGFFRISKEFDTLLIDHHPLHNNKKEYSKLNVIKCSSTNSAGYIVYNLGIDTLREDYYEELMLASLISDYGFKDKNLMKLIQKKYGNVTKDNAFDCRGGVLAKKINSSLVYTGKNFDLIWKILSKRDLKKLEEAYDLIEDEIKKSVSYCEKYAKYYEKYKLYFIHYTPRYNYMSALTTIFSGNHKEDTFVMLSDVTNDQSKIKISSRNQSGNVEMNKMLEASINGLDNAISGGHLNASGGVIMRKDLEKFKRQMLDYFEKNLINNNL
ncbi:hypothetical protein COU57_01655 [Candidatus Pacearchaeota archaeon CG10_big_fil_rev_8_21_14_0_10_32_14]|nr:MAG: hypothetical protein COU57_01655 [Candidatus Pacearchaeota archaeon CG10_big_fil_rev_8_21_14_0_10_32_14]